MSLRQAFPELVPSRPFCANDFAEGIRIRPQGQALRRLHVQFNHPKFIRWLLLDLDRADAYFRDEDALLPAFNVLIRNPANGHAHAAYVLDVPVAAHDAARQKPLKLLAAVERGLVRRLAADRAYSGLLAKNPLHPHWKVEWRRKEPYSLEELTGWLSQEDMRPEPEHESSGHGRNCALFDQLRGLAYREVLPFKRAGGSAEAWRARLSKAAANTNSGFAEPLGTAEVRGIAKSVAKWTWNSSSAARFSAIQAERAKKRWQGHKAESAIKPWLEMGISERTYYRRKKDGK